MTTAHQDYAQTFALIHNRAQTNWQVPVPDNAPPLIAKEVAEYRAAFEAWDELADVLEDINGQLANAARQDQQAVRSAAKAGTLSEMPSLTPNHDAAVRRMAEAWALHADADSRCLAAARALLEATQDHRSALLADLVQQQDALAELARPYEAALSAIREHSTRNARLTRWVEAASDTDLPRFNGRPLDFLPALPKSLPKAVKG